MGDSLAADYHDWGWSPHFAYEIARDELPFDVINLARGYAMVAPPAASKPGDANSCLNKQFPEPVGVTSMNWQYQTNENWGRFKMA